MTAVALLRELTARGVQLTAEGEALRYRGPRDAITPDLLAAIKAQKAQLLSLLSTAADAELLRFPRDPANHYAPFPLTDIQQAYVIGEQDFFAQRTVAALYQQYQTPPLDLQRFKAAVNAVIRVHDILRLAIRPDGTQIVRPESTYEPIFEDLRGLDPDQTLAHIEAKRNGLARELSPLDQGPPWCIAVQQLDDYCRVHIVVRLTAFDAVTLNLIYQDLMGYYESSSYVAPLSDLSFRDYVLGLVRYRQSAGYQRSLGYWRARAPDLPAPPELPRARKRATGESTLKRCSGRLAADEWQEFCKHAKAFGRPINSVLCTVFTDTLHLWSKHPSFTINLLSANRPPSEPATATVVGNCSTTTLVEVSASGGTFVDRVQSLQRRLYADLEHNAVSGVAVIRDLQRTRVISDEPPMPVVFTSGIGLLGGDENFDLLIPRDDWRLIESRLSTPQVWLDHQVSLERGQLVFNWDFSMEVFPPGMIDEMFAHYRAHLTDLVARRAAWTESNFPIQAEQLAKRISANATQVPLPRKTLQSLFQESAREHPDSPAVLSRRGSWTYDEVDRYSLKVASALRRHGVQRGDLVGVLLSKSPEQVVATLGVLRAGAAYLPIDARLPHARVTQILEHSHAKALVVDPAIGAASLTLPGLEIVPIPPMPMPDERLDDADTGVEDTDVAYVIYTSGSTGTPKGVAISHRGAVNTLHDVIARFEVTHADRVLALSSLGFDLSVFDIFGSFAAGAVVVVPDDDDVPNPGLWIQAVEQFGVTVWNSVPALLEMALDYIGVSNVSRLESLRLVMLSGDWIPLPLVDRLLRAPLGIRLIGLGGATEASIWSNYFEITSLSPEWVSVPYGYPLANQTMHILNAQLQPVPTWVVGDLYIGGVGVANGYLNDPDKTTASFIVHPETGERLYHTGDLALYLPDGAIEFMGRADSQVKIRGFRVELGEIEAVAHDCPGVDTAVAVVQGDNAQEQRLVLFVVGTNLTEELIRSIETHLSDRLPGYMVPATIEPLEALPLSPNGKVDRGALRHRAVETQSESKRSTSPRNETEIRLLALWCDVLERTDIGTEDDFFAIGGNSLMAVRLFSAIERVFHRRLPLPSLFRNSTIVAQSRLLMTDPVREPNNAIVRLSTETTTGPVLMLFHPVGGDVLCYRELGQQLSASLTPVGVRCPGLDEGATMPHDLESAADHFVRAIQETYPTEQLFLGGWSMGGVMAYEVARQLQRSGRMVSGLVMIDSWLGRDELETRTTEFGLLLGFFVDLLGNQQVADILSDLSSRPSQDRLPSAVSSLHAHGLLSRDLDLERADRLFKVYQANMRALERYRPEPLRIRTLAFYAARQPQNAFSNLRPFVARAPSLLGNSIDVLTLDVDHYAIMRSPVLRQMAAEIGKRIATWQQARTG